ncbi:MAG TPA: DUF3562 domain-containing protein [Nitrospirota bacterium]|nr:DUF3562 domain-containing protein [Nitrospirota bacterium]
MYENSLINDRLVLKKNETNKHKDAILKLAEDLGAPPDEVKKSYEEILEQFKNATIKDFVPIFVSRCVRERLKHTSSKKVSVSHV